MHWIVDEVIGERHARAFLLQSDIEDPLIDYLYDSRVLHIIKSNVSGRDIPGRRYNAYAIDYGCYCHLANTRNYPSSLLANEDEEELKNVPQDDFRSIRRAILDLKKFRESIAG